MKRHDLTGKKFNKLTALSVNKVLESRVYWNCLCDCGKNTIVHASKLTSLHTKSCGCIRLGRANPSRVDIKDHRFGRTVAKEYIGSSVWGCVCDCGKEHKATYH